MQINVDKNDNEVIKVNTMNGIGQIIKIIIIAKVTCE